VHDFDIIQAYEPADLVALMKAIGRPAQQHKATATMVVAARTIEAAGRQISYFVYLENDALCLVGQLKLEGPPSIEYIVNWNNFCPISPLIGMDNGAILKFALNVRRSTTLASFRTVITQFEKHYQRLGAELTSCPSSDDLAQIAGPISGVSGSSGG